jgi:hypothetical protein
VFFPFTFAGRHLDVGKTEDGIEDMRIRGYEDMRIGGYEDTIFKYTQ